jgi:hypothetical protein
MKSGHVPGSLDRLQHLGDTNGGGEAEQPGDHCPHRANRQPEQPGRCPRQPGHKRDAGDQHGKGQNDPAHRARLRRQHRFLSASRIRPELTASHSPRAPSASSILPIPASPVRISSRPRSGRDHRPSRPSWPAHGRGDRREGRCLLLRTSHNDSVDLPSPLATACRTQAQAPATSSCRICPGDGKAALERDAAHGRGCGSCPGPDHAAASCPCWSFIRPGQAAAQTSRRR